MFSSKLHLFDDLSEALERIGSAKFIDAFSKGALYQSMKA